MSSKRLIEEFKRRFKADSQVVQTYHRPSRLADLLKRKRNALRPLVGKDNTSKAERSSKRPKAKARVNFTSQSPGTEGENDPLDLVSS